MLLSWNVGSIRAFCKVHLSIVILSFAHSRFVLPKHLTTCRCSCQLIQVRSRWPVFIIALIPSIWGSLISASCFEWVSNWVDKIVLRIDSSILMHYEIYYCQAVISYTSIIDRNLKVSFYVTGSMKMYIGFSWRCNQHLTGSNLLLINFVDFKLTNRCHLETYLSHVVLSI